MSNGTASADLTLLEAVVQTVPAMTTSSAEPARLEAYPDVLAAADEELTVLARDLDRALGAFADGAGAYLPAGFDPASDGNLVRGLRDESRYLADWVARIGAGFRAADTDLDGDGIFSANDGLLDGLVGPATVAEAMTIPPAGTSPEEVAQWWATLPLNLRDRLIQSDYAQLGRLRGLPAEDTDRVNRRRLERDLYDLMHRQADIGEHLANVRMAINGQMRTPSGQVDPALYARRDQLLADQERIQTELGNAQKILDQMAALDQQHREDPTGHARPYLLTYGYQNEGRFAVALGNPDYADNTGVVVPGTGHDVKKEGGLFGPVSDGERLLGRMNAQSGGTNNSVIVWMGADMPDDFGAAMNGTYGDSEHGAAWLRDDVAGYRAAHAQAHAGYPPARGDSHMTVVAHSYGSYMTGEAIKAGMEVDDFVSVGSPGVDADNAGELGMANEHVWAGAVQSHWPADDDFIADTGWHGTPPTGASFDATVFDTSDSVGHSEYYKQGFFGEPSQSLENMARIAVGRYDDVERRPPDPLY